MNQDPNSPEAQAYKALEKAVGHLEFPHTVTLDRDGKVVEITYEKEWKAGGVESIDTGKKDINRNPIIEYKENYSKKSLTKKQIENLDKAIATIIEV